MTWLKTKSHNSLKQWAGAILVALAFTPAFAAPPYDITVTFTPPSAGPVPGSYNLYIDDCAVSGPLSAPFGQVSSGQTFVAALPIDSIYEVCVRSVNVTGENPNPGPVATIAVADLPIPNPVENLDVAVSCPNGGCTITVTVN